MKKKKIISMLLAGGQGSRLGVLTNSNAKPSVSFGGMYKIIDFPMSNAVNSDIDTVGILTQYQPLALNRHIGIGTPWDLDSNSNGGGAVLLSPYAKEGSEGNWYTGTANAIYHNIDFIENYDPDYVLILSGDHIYKSDYSKMLKRHQEQNADVTIAVLDVPLDEASRFGIMNADDDGVIYEFEEKPKDPKSTLASMGIYIFSWPVLRKALIEDNVEHHDSDFGKHIIPKLLEQNKRLVTYIFDDYWRDVGTIESYWQANMELIKTVPEFNLYDRGWNIYTNAEKQEPHYVSGDADVKSSLIADCCEIHGSVHGSVIGENVTIKKGALVKDSIIMDNTVIGENCSLVRTIISENCIINDNVSIGFGENIPNVNRPQIYNTGITVLGEHTEVPPNISIGQNCVITGKTYPYQYPQSRLESGMSIYQETMEV